MISMISHLRNNKLCFLVQLESKRECSIILISILKKSKKYIYKNDLIDWMTDFISIHGIYNKKWNG